MNRTLFTFFLSITLFVAFGQSRRAIMEITPRDGQARWSSTVHQVPLEDPEPFLAYFLKWEGDIGELMIRFSSDGIRWSEWKSMPRDEHSTRLPVSILGITAATDRYFQLKGHAAPEEDYHLECHFYSPGPEEAARDRPSETGQARSCDELMPDVVRRTEWCPNGNCGEHPNPAFADVSHLVIHHSAGTNLSNNWSAVVRAIWDLHVNGNGWSDIGYNWLIDPEGRVYEGRGDDAIGAHFCAKNTGTVGICVMGTFTNEPPKGAAVEALVDLLSWKACVYDIDPLAEAFHASSNAIKSTIIGHRDGCDTACPGDMFYPLLPAVREAVMSGVPTAINELDERWPGLVVFPNPSQGAFQFKLSEKLPEGCHLSIYDQQGRRVLGPQLVATGRGETQLFRLPAGSAAGAYRLVLQVRGTILGSKQLFFQR